jgi:hypothetical protein
MIVLRGRFEFYVILHGGLWSASPMAAALAGIVHGCQGTDNHQRNRNEDNC